MIAQQHTIPSLSGTFGIHTRLALNPKMPKEPSSPSRSDTRTECQCINNEINPPFNQHLFKRRRRYTLKADSEKSFQPQTESGELIDIIPFFNQQGITTDTLINSMSKNKSGKKSMNSRPFKLTTEQSNNLYDYLIGNSTIKIKGKDIRRSCHEHRNENRKTNGICKRKEHYKPGR